MNIQQNVNALLTMGAVAARSSDLYQRNMAIKNTEREITANARIMANDPEVDRETFKSDPSAYQDVLAIRTAHAKKRLDLDEQLAGLDPNKINAREQSESYGFYQAELSDYRTALQAAQEESMAGARNSRTAVPEMKKVLTDKEKIEAYQDKFGY